MREDSEHFYDWLVRMARQNDQRAFQQLFERFYPELMRFALFYLKSRETSEELVQDVFLKIWQMRAMLLTILNFRAYLFTTTRNQCLSYLRKNRPIFTSFDDSSEVNTVVNDNNPQQTIEFEETQLKVTAAVEALPSRCRLIFQLVKEQGFSYKEVADLLSISPRTVETQIGIAMRKLAAALHYQTKG